MYSQTFSSHCAFRLLPLVALFGVIFSPAVYASNFTIANGETVITTQTLADNETGVIQAGGVLDVTTGGGVSTSGSSITITNRGTITTSGFMVYGIRATGSDATITNSGAISTARDYAYGIHSTGSNATLTNSGTVTTWGDVAHGIYSAGSDATITNSGTITTSGGAAFGIYSTGHYAMITNSGRITTGGANGIFSTGNYATITNSGTISTAEGNAYGIHSTGSNATITNSGTITTSGYVAFGIDSTGSNATLTNSGAISTAGDFAYGIFSEGANVTLTNSGSINVTGSDAIGIAVIGSGTNTLNISGSVMATGAATQAILGQAGNETLNLYPGARVIGTVDLGAGTNTVNVMSNGAGPSATMSISNPGTINTTRGNALSFVNNGTNTVHLVDTTSITASQASLGSISSGILQSVSQQLSRAPALRRPVKVAASEPVSGIWADDTQPVGWGQVFGKYTKRGSDGAALSFQDRTYGVIGGYEQRLGDHRAGVFGGVAQSDMDTSASSASTDSNSAFAGVYGQYALDQWRVNAAMALGYANYNGDRTVTDNLYGNETASADYHGWYLSPSVAIARIFDQGAGFSLRPSVELNYTYGHLSAYDESGTTRSNLSVGSRTAQVLNTRLQLAARQELAGKKGDIEWRGGISHTHYGDDTTTVSLQGVGSSRYSMTGTGDVTGAYVGFGGRYQWKQSFNLVGDIELFHSDDNDKAVMGYLGMEYRF